MNVWALMLVCSILCDGVLAVDFPPFDASVWIVVWVLTGVCVVLLIAVVVLSVLLALSKKKARLQAKPADAFQSHTAFPYTIDTDLNTRLDGATSDANMNKSTTPGSSATPSPLVSYHGNQINQELSK